MVAITAGVVFLPLTAGAAPPTLVALQPPALLCEAVLQWESHEGGVAFDYDADTDAAGNVYAADNDGHIVEKYSSDGTWLGHIGISGEGPGELGAVQDVAVNKTTGDIYIIDDMVNRFNSAGNFLNEWDVLGGRNVAIDSLGNVYVTTYENMVHVFTATGIPTGIPWDAVGNSSGASNEIQGIAIDSLDRVYLTYNDHPDGPNIVQRFSNTGTWQFAWGGTGTGDGQFSRIQEIAINENDQVFVVDSEQARVQIFDSDGTYLGSFGGPGNGLGLFERPQGVATGVAGSVYVVSSNDHTFHKFICTPPPPPICEAVLQWTAHEGSVSYNYAADTDAAGNVYVADNDGDIVEKYDSDGAWLGHIGTTGEGPGQLYAVQDVAVNKTTGDVYVIDNMVARFNSAGLFLNEWHLHWASHVAVDSSGNVYVTTYDNMVHMFTATGTPIGTPWDATGNGLGEINEIQGIAIDSLDRVYMTYSKVLLAGSEFVVEPNIVQRFSSTGTWQLAWGGTGTGDGQFLRLEDLTITGNNEVFVVDSDQARVQVFDSNGAYLGSFGGPGSGLGLFDTPHGVATSTDGSAYVLSSNDFTIHKFACTLQPPSLQQCAFDALAAMGITPGTFPAMEAEINANCDDSVPEDDMTIVEAGEEPPNNYQMEPNEVLVLGEDSNINNNIIGDDNSPNQLFIGHNVTIDNNTLKIEKIWVAGTGNLILGNVNHEVSIYIGPGAFLRINGNANTVQSLVIGAGGTLSLGGNLDIYMEVFLDPGAELIVEGTLACTGTPSVSVDPSAIITTGTNNCALLAP
jgi:hypothetical protein